MPNTLNLIAEHGVTFNRYYVSYPLCCPRGSASSPAATRTTTTSAATSPPNGGYTGFASQRAYNHNLATWLQGAGYRTIHVGKFLNGYGDEPYDNGNTVPPGWSAWHTVLNADTDHYFYGYTMNDNGVDRRPLRRLGQLGNARIRRTRRLRLPQRPAERQALLLPDRHLQPDRDRRAAGHAAGTALLPAGRLHRPARRLPPAGRARAGAALLRLLRRRPAFRTAARRDSTRATSTTSPRFIREAPYLYPERNPHLPGLLPEGAGVAALGRRRGQADRRHARRAAPAAQHLHHLHLRQRLLLRRAPPHRRQVPRLRALDPPALPDARARGSSPAARRASWPRTSTSRRPSSNSPKSKPDKSIDGRSLYPFAHDTSLRTRRPILFESFVETNDVEENGGGPPPRRPGSRQAGGGPASTPAREGHRLDRRAAQELLRDPPRPLQVHRVARRRERALRHQQGPLRAQQHGPGPPTSSRSAPSCTRNWTARDLRRRAAARKSAPQTPLTRTSSASVKRRKEREQREREREHAKRTGGRERES